MSGISKLGKYLIRREIGKGAMGVVYEGFDPSIERKVAIKTILPQQLSGAQASEVLERFKREAQAAGRLNHPGIVAIYDYGEVVAEDDRTMLAGAVQATPPPQVVFIAMEYIQGRELKDCFDGNERFPIAEVARIMTEILDALSHAHSHGVVHRDIKPANLIMLDNGSVKIADFGIARVEKSELTQVGTVMGTPSYMSPEQFMGQGVDGRSDLFSCGVILYQFLTGEKPFTGSTTTIMYKVLREDPLEPSLLNAALPKAFDEVLKKAVAKDPDQRFQTAEEFSAAIRTAAAKPVQAKPVDPADSTVINPLTAVPAKPTPRRAALKLWLAAAGAVLALGIGWSLLSEAPEQEQVPAPVASPAPEPLPASSSPQPIASVAEVVPSVMASAPAASASATLAPPASAPVTLHTVAAARPVPPMANGSAPKPVAAPSKPRAAAVTVPTSGTDAVVAPVVEADPKKTCDGRVMLGYLFCMNEQCAKPTLQDHATCREWRAMEKSKREAREAGQ